MKQKILTSSVLAFVLFGSVAFAQTSSTGSSTAPVVTPLPASSTAPGKLNSACVLAAISKRDAAFKAAGDLKQKTLSDARTARDSALDAAKQLADKSARAAARKTAQAGYEKARKAAMAAYRSARQAAKDQFGADRKACRAAQSGRQR